MDVHEYIPNYLLNVIILSLFSQIKINRLYSSSSSIFFFLFTIVTWNHLI